MRICSDDSGYPHVIAFSLIFPMMLGLAASWNFESTALNLLLFAFSTFSLLMFHASRMAKSAYFEIDIPKDCMFFQKVNLLGKKTLDTYKLSDFHGVVSFLNSPTPDTGDRYNYVELIAKQKGKGLVVARFHPSRLDKKFLHSPTFGESAKAAELRLFFVEQCSMVDLGFTGHRSVREQLKPKANASHIE